MTHLEIAHSLRNGEKVYNCGQTLVMTYSKELGMTKEDAMNAGRFFGAGMLHGGTCGTISAAMLILGKLNASPQDASRIVNEFKESHKSTQGCELLKMSRENGISKKVHCDGLIYEMIEKIDECIKNAD